MGSVIIAGWLLVLTVVFNVALMNQLTHQANGTLRARAQDVAATVEIAENGNVSVQEAATDAPLDTGIWVYVGVNAVERPLGGEAVQKLADSLVGHGERVVDNLQIRFLSLPVYDHNRQVATVIASADLEPYRHAERSALIGSTALCFLALAGSYPVLRIAARRALRPVDAMTRQAADWSAHAVGRRFGGEHRFGEMQSLAQSLDNVLDHLSAVVRHEHQLSAELSHELRTPLARITAETDLLLTRPYSTEQTRAAHRSIHEAAQSLERILDTLLAAGRSETNDAPGRCDIRAVLDDLVHTFSTPTERRAITIRADHLAVGVDATLVERVLSPVIENAIRYAHSAVLITAYRSTEWVLVDISDDGPGLAPGLQDAVFEPGFRAYPADSHSGHGLGLALARRLARTADGDISVVLGSSTIFRIQLPPG